MDKVTLSNISIHQDTNTVITNWKAIAMAM